MTFLKKIGQAIATGAKFLAIAEGFIQTAPAQIEAFVQSELAKLLGAIVDVEATGAALLLTGEQKFTAAVPKVRQIVLGFLTATGHDVADATLFDKAVAGITQAIVDLANSLKPKD